MVVRVHLWLWPAVMVVALAACSTQSHAPVTLAPPLAMFPTGDPNELMRFVDVTWPNVQTTRRGGNFNHHMPYARVTRVGDSAAFTPNFQAGGATDGSSLAFACYPLCASLGSNQLSLDWGASPQTPVWLGLANWVGGHWDWFELPGGETLAGHDLSPYMDSYNRILVCVMLLGSQEQMLGSITSENPPAVEPRITFLPDQSGTSNELYRFDLGVVGEEPLSYNWEFGGAASPNASTDKLPLVTLGHPGIYTVSVTVSNAHGTDTKSCQLSAVEPEGWVHTYSPPGDLYSYCVDTATTPDGGYILCARAESFDNTTGDLGIVMRLNGSGDVEWANSLYWSATDRVPATLGRVVVDAQGAVYALASFIGGYAAIVAKLSPSGDLVWSRWISAYAEPYSLSLAPVDDGRVAVVVGNESLFTMNGADGAQGESHRYYGRFRSPDGSSGLYPVALHSLALSGGKLWITGAGDTQATPGVHMDGLVLRLDQGLHVELMKNYSLHGFPSVYPEVFFQYASRAYPDGAGGIMVRGQSLYREDAFVLSLNSDMETHYATHLFDCEGIDWLWGNLNPQPDGSAYASYCALPDSAQYQMVGVICHLGPLGVPDAAWGWNSATLSAFLASSFEETGQMFISGGSNYLGATFLPRQVDYAALTMTAAPADIEISSEPLDDPTNFLLAEPVELMVDSLAGEGSNIWAARRSLPQ